MALLYNVLLTFAPAFALVVLGIYVMDRWETPRKRRLTLGE